LNAQKCGEFIAELRKEKNLTQKDLANELNVSDKAISRWETGKGFPDVDSLQALSKFFSVTINELLAGEKAEIETFEEKSGEKIENKKIEILAEENIISAFKEKEEVKKSNKIISIIFSIFFGIVFFIAILAHGSETSLKYLAHTIKIENPWEFAFLLFMELCIFSLGLLVSKGHYKILHKYHYRNVTNKKEYSKKIGIGIMWLSAPLFVTTILSMWSSFNIIAIISSAILPASYIFIIIYLITVQVKYNGGIF